MNSKFETKSKLFKILDVLEVEFQAVIEQEQAYL